MVKVLSALLASSSLATQPFPPSKGDGSWQWVPIEGSKCMDGTETGVYVMYSQSGSSNLGIYLYGGGACFNKVTCATTTGNNPFEIGHKGIFEPRSDNPLADWNWVSVYYCTGDVHTGDTVTEVGGKNRSFAGRANLKLVMERTVATFESAETLLITGGSAGGFGAILNYDVMRDYYPQARGVLVDDSGPVIADDALPACLQGLWKDLWNMRRTLPEDCRCSQGDGDLVSAWDYFKTRYPTDSFSLVSSVNDVVISSFFAFGNNDCKAVLPVGYNKLQDGLESLAQSGVPVYMIPGRMHGHLTSDEFFSRTVQGANFFEWVGQLLDADQPDPSTVRPTLADHLKEELVSNSSVVV